VLLNYHTGRFVLGSLCVGDLVRLGLSSVRFGSITYNVILRRLSLTNVAVEKQ